MDFLSQFDPLRPLRHVRPRNDDSLYTSRRPSRAPPRQFSRTETEVITKSADKDVFEDIELWPRGEPIADPEPDTPLGRTRREIITEFKWWTEEYFYAFVCVAFATGLGLMLKYFDNSLVPQALFWNVQFDTIVIALVTVVRVSLKAFVEAAISQGAWLWVAARSQRRCKHVSRLKDFKLFDEASRGLKGSLILLWCLKFRFVVLAGVGRSDICCKVTPPIAGISVLSGL
jgi:hypothetical protein